METQVKPQGEEQKPQRAPRPVYLDDVRLDRMLGAIVELTAQLYVAKDRTRVLEQLLIDKGVLTAEEIEFYSPDPEFEARATKDREELLKAVISRNFLEE
jgi:hypothetical protein